MNILVFGAGGQIGSALLQALAPLGTVHGRTRKDVDLADEQAIAAEICALQPALIVNAAAYTAVDLAESEPELARTINGAACGAMARAAGACQALLIHYSTDYVFDGAKREPYLEDDATDPINIYGDSKLQGEHAIAVVPCDWIILRTTWVFAPEGKNFVRTMLRLARDRDQLNVIDDQHGAPTYGPHLALATAELAGLALERRRSGTFSSGLYHLTGGGSTTWFGFAAEIVSQWRAAQGAASLRAQISPISAAQYPTPAARPKNSRLSNAKIWNDFGIKLPHWQAGLEECLASLNVASL